MLLFGIVCQPPLKSHWCRWTNRPPGSCLYSVPNSDIRDLVSHQWPLLAILLRACTQLKMRAMADVPVLAWCSLTARLIHELQQLCVGPARSWSPLCGDVVHVSLGCGSGLASFLTTGVRWTGCCSLFYSKRSTFFW